jgi:DNA polymerase-3 subunit epsilon
LTKPNSGCALAELGRCLAPCLAPDPQRYAEQVAEVRAALLSDIRPTLRRAGVRIRALIDQQRFEEAEEVRRRLAAYTQGVRRWHRLRSLADCPQIVATCWNQDHWEVHVFRHGQLAGVSTAASNEEVPAAAEAAIGLAATVVQPSPGLPGGSVEEAELISAWLETPGVRLLSIDGEWSWPARIGADPEQLPQLILGE